VNKNLIREFLQNETLLCTTTMIQPTTTLDENEDADMEPASSIVDIEQEDCDVRNCSEYASSIHAL